MVEFAKGTARNIMSIFSARVRNISVAALWDDLNATIKLINSLLHTDLRLSSEHPQTERFHPPGTIESMIGSRSSKRDPQDPSC